MVWNKHHDSGIRGLATIFYLKDMLEVQLIKHFGSNDNSMCEEFVAAMYGEFEMPMMGELT